MKRIVLVTYNWPPRNAIGTHRPYAWAKYWARQGNQVTVLTSKKQPFDQPLDLELPELSGVEVIETDVVTRAVPGLDAGGWEYWLSAMKKFKRLLRSQVGFVVDSRDGWQKGSSGRLLELATSADCVVSTFGPRASHFIAAEMKALNPKLCWIADFRDLWSQNHLTNYSSRAKQRETRLEQTTLRQVDVVTTVSEELAVTLGAVLSRDVVVVPNGFDLEEVSPPPEGSPKFPRRIVYTGLLYPGSRDPGPLLKALQELQNEGGSLKGRILVEFFGPETDWLQTQIDQARLQDIVLVRGRVDRPTALASQRAADRLLLLESGAPEAKGVVTGKIFEYLAAGRPVLSLGSGVDSAIGRVLRQCGIGICLEGDVALVKAEILTLLEGTTPVWFKPSQNEIMEYSRERQAARVLELMRKVMVNA